jgi:hypothetical protein
MLTHDVISLVIEPSRDESGLLRLEKRPRSVAEQGYKMLYGKSRITLVFD